ncbi:hypothetical protein COT62_02440 [Candidatus Roizmanbacteria bacterium CG09_land_8_20_14_0_10_41_9]|uniref:LytR/CpsA/Psr regulator C-terminal domain-containing protein n=1 Tax=Candidatus Roizmanbacteria bacterium CG09_land_8_20_14_0_10_41_9 TaxID=1974850 RepID=A0A2H0WSS5_9BACT|nr:MAG: hypothetical protein COT62_02440 [Candidatus Roizmanbacteria bacterium CG09_land_8_20_14_0_10_41_9]
MEDSISYNPNQRAGGKKNTTVIIVIVLIVVAIIGGIYLVRQPQKKDEGGSPLVEKKVSTPSPTEKPEIDKESVKIQVLNGTGTPGQAGTAVKALEEAGYNADNIETSNADEFGDTVTTITARKGFDEVAKDIKDALKATFDNVEIDSSHLDEDSEFDISIVTGGKEYKEATPSAEPTESEEVTPTESSGTPTPTPTVATTTLTPGSTTP